MLDINAANMVTRAKQGDSAAIAELYEQHHQGIYRYLYYRVNNPHIAEDLTSEVFTRMIASLPRYQWQQVSFQAWLYQIARNLAIDHYRKMKFRRFLSLEEDVVAPSEELAVTVDQRLTSENLRQALNQLNDDQRDVIVLRFIAGMPIQEVAQLMKKSEDAVKGLQRRGLMALREVLSELEVSYV